VTITTNEENYFRRGGLLAKDIPDEVIELIQPENVISEIEMDYIDSFFDCLADAKYKAEKIISVKLSVIDGIQIESELDYMMKLAIEITESLELALQIIRRIKKILNIDGVNFEWFSYYDYQYDNEIIKFKDFSDYFYSQVLFLDCIKVAAVSDRTNTLNSIFFNSVE
jgi:hypothetical protein